MAKFIANWQLQGLTEQPLEAGMVIELSDVDAEVFLADGVLSRLAESEAPALTLDDLTQPELLDIAKKTFGVKLDKRLTRDEVLELVKEMDAIRKGENLPPADPATKTKETPE
jgi:hypothetical protein